MEFLLVFSTLIVSVNCLQSTVQSQFAKFTVPAVCSQSCCAESIVDRSFNVRTQAQCIHECQHGGERSTCVGVNYRQFENVCEVFNKCPAAFSCNKAGCQYQQNDEGADKKNCSEKSYACDTHCAGKCITTGTGKCDSLCQPGYVLTNESNCSLVSSCKAILRVKPSAPSGIYTILPLRRTYKVYCEMGLNNGGYNFFNGSDIGVLTNDELQAIYTDTTSFLFRALATDSTQSYGVFRQLPMYSTIPLKLGLNNYTGYFPPTSYATSSYIYYGFLPVALVTEGQTSGLQVNGYSVSYTRCDANPINYFSLYNEPPTAGYTGNFNNFNQLKNRMMTSPPANHMPRDYYTVMWTCFGGCGWCLGFDGQSSYDGMLLAAIGFR